MASSVITASPAGEAVQLEGRHSYCIEQQMALILDIWDTHTCNSEHTQSRLKVSIQCRVLYSGPQRLPMSLGSKV